MRNPLSKEMQRLLLGFTLGTTGTGLVVTQTDIMNQFLNEKEGNQLVAYADGKGIWTICRGVTSISGRPVKKGMRMTQAQCDLLNDKEAEKSLQWVQQNIPVPLNPIQEVGIASFCPYNLGPYRCMYNKDGSKTQFWQSMQKGDWKAACKQIPKWVFDGGKNCNIRSNNCYGQVLRREQEEYLCLYTLGEVD